MKVQRRSTLKYVIVCKPQWSKLFLSVRYVPSRQSERTPDQDDAYGEQYKATDDAPRGAEGANPGFNLGEEHEHHGEHIVCHMDGEAEAQIARAQEA